MIRRSCYPLLKFTTSSPSTSSFPFFLHIPVLLSANLRPPTTRVLSFRPFFCRQYASEAHNFKREKENDIKSVLDMARRRMNYNECVKRLEFLQEEVKKPNFWEDSQSAQAMAKEKANLERKLSTYENIQGDFNSYLELMEMGTKEKDKEMTKEALSILDNLHAKVEELELAAIMSDPADPGSCYLEIHAGAGGMEAMDWAAMVLKMYTNWAARKNFSLEILHQNNGDVGIKSVACKLSGDYAYGWVKTESGIHRLIRVSPYDSNGKRHTSFCAVSISPIVDDTIDLNIQPKDLKIETMRASGAGGQHVNRTESAVRITHIPTGLSVHCANQRSQHQNKDEAMSILKGRIYQHEAEKRQKIAQENYSNQVENAWGSQIRTYTLHPGSRVKDQRTNYETSDVDAILEGTDELDVFMKKALQWFAIKDHPPEGEKS